MKCYVKTILDLICQYVPQNLFFQSNYILVNYVHEYGNYQNSKKMVEMPIYTYIYIYTPLSISHLMPSIAFTSN